MKIHNEVTGEYIKTSCTGCMCHDMAMVFGSDPHICAECGCPKTLEGFERVKQKQIRECTHYTTSVTRSRSSTTK